MTTCEPGPHDESEHYSYRVVWSVPHQVCVATVDELPWLSWVASDHIAALSGIRNRAREAVAERARMGRTVPPAHGAARKPHHPSNVAPDAAVPLWVPSEIYAELLRAASEQHLDVRWLAHSRLAGSREIARLEHDGRA